MTTHIALVAQQSPTLRALVSGFMKEAQTRTAIWKDVDEDTFARFAQFAYTEDYAPSPCSIEEDSSPLEHNDETLEDSVPGPPDSKPEQDWKIGLSSSFVTHKKDKKKRTQLVDRVGFYDLVYKVPCSNFANICKIRSNESLVEDYTLVFLSHAQLYVFAEKWGIKPLKVLVLHKLHATLCQYEVYEARYGDIIELIKYTYEYTPCRKHMDPLRKLVTQYVSFEQPQIAGSKPCLSLIEDGGSFSRDLLSMLLEKVK